MLKNEEKVGVVSRLGSNGEGIIKDGEYTVFVPYCLPDEKIRYKVLKVKDKVAFGKLIEVYTPAEERVRPLCDVYEKCGGCQLQHLKYKLQLKLKSKIVKDCFSKIAFIDVDVPTTIKSDLEYGYRNKLQLPVRTDNFGVSIGFFAENSHRIIPINSCPIQPKWCEDVISCMKEYIKKYGVSVYSDLLCEGLIKHVVVRSCNGEFLITVVINGTELPCVDGLIAILGQKFHEFSLFININELNNNVIFGDTFKCLHGKEKIITNDLGIKYEIGPASFMQVNDDVKRKIYQDAVKLSMADGETVVIDAYSGAGMLTAIFAMRSKYAIGIEIIKEAVDCADGLKVMNGLDGKMENICGKCEEILPTVIERVKRSGNKSVLILDPPRQGIDESLVKVIRANCPDRIIYISCSPQTLARDIGLLSGRTKREGSVIKVNDGERLYEIESVQTYDMFPQTKHVETLVCLARKAK